MAWHPDVPDLPIRKPKKIEKLERMDRKILDAMPSVEVNEMVRDIAQVVANDYKAQIKNATYEECVEVVSVALTVTGSGIDTQVGLAMISANETAAKTACRIAFNIDEEG